MDKLTHKKELLDKISTAEGPTFIYNEKAILEDYHAQTENTSSLSIKVLSIFGGLLATLAFLGFLALTGLYNSGIGMLIFGSAFVISAIAINKAVNKLIIDTFCLSLYISGFILLAFGLDTLKIDNNITLYLISSIAIIALCITQNYILSFSSILIISGSFLGLILSNEVYDFIPLYIAFYSIILTYTFLNEAKLLAASKKIAKLYNPLKIAFIFSLVFGLITIGKRHLLPIAPQQLWLSAIAILAINLYLVSVIIKINAVSAKKTKVLIYSLSVLILGSTLLSPAISGAFLIILLSVLVNYKTGLAIGIIAFLYFIIQYYYDLNFNLLTKSMLLMFSGVAFLAFYVFISKQLKSNEKL